MAYTREEIIACFPDLPIAEVYDNKSLWEDEVSWYMVYRRHYEKKITRKEWMAYQAIWRNSAFRLSDVSIEYEIKETDNA